MKLWEILVPTVSNEGKPFNTRYHMVWDTKVQAISGGLTILTPVKGRWVASDGKLFVERMIPVRVACSEEQIEKIADLTAKHYRQQTILFYCVSSDVRIKDYGAKYAACPA